MYQASEENVRRLAAWVAKEKNIIGWEILPFDQLILELRGVGVVRRQSEDGWPRVHYERKD